MHHFQGRENELGWWQKKEAQEFDYGYALTAHKSQGSQWKEVLVFDESACFRQDAQKWLYTAVTRAEEKVTIVRV
jgi:exodeoxyribonuclease-5